VRVRPGVTIPARPKRGRTRPTPSSLRAEARRWSRAGSHFDENIVALGLDGEAGDFLVRFVVLASGGDVVTPSVPRAGDGCALEFALAERTATMQAGIVNRVELSTGVEQRDRLATGLDCLAGSLCDFAAPRDFHEVAHRQLPPFVVATRFY